MTETKRQIKELREALPHIREKVVAVAVLLAMSVAMMASVSYAWYTMSLAPEASSITTQVSSNGNLEVALAGLYDEDGNLVEPFASAVGDSFSADGKATVNANLTWGNLINLSGNYGIENLVLRPAILAEGSKKLLSSIYYGEDGRYESENVDFGFTSWREVDGKYTFAVTDGANYGVRAISMVTYPDGKGAMQEKLDESQGLYNFAGNAYARIVRDSDDNEYLAVIESLVEVYVNAEVNKMLSSSTDDTVIENKYIESLYNMMEDLHTNVVSKFGEALVVMANAQLSLKSNTYEPYTLETLVAAGTNDNLKKNGVDLSNSYNIFYAMYTGTRSDLSALQTHNENKATDPVYWSELEPIVNRLIAIDDVLINGMTMTQLKSAIKSNLTGTLGELKNASVTVRGGFLRDIELLCGPQLNASVGFKVMSIYSINANIRTNLFGTTYTTYYNLDKAATEAMADDADLEFTGTMVAGDTYGMVVDLWVRTNAADALLMLDGMVSTKTYYELRKVVLGGESSSRQVFTYTYTVIENIMGQDMEVDHEQYLYQVPKDLDEDGTIAESSYPMTLNGESVTVTVYEGYFYDVTTGLPAYVVDENGEATETPLDHTYVTQSKVIVPTTDSYEVVTGFESSNRVDDDYEAFISSGNISATQGSGSCYIFYADTPEEYASALELLEHLKVAFADYNGNVLAKAILDVDHVYEDNGKYTVPLVIQNSNWQDDEGTYAITKLQQNQATFISAVVYLDGDGLENSMVMETGSIQGSLNLQFATNMDEMEPMDNTDLSLKTVSLTAAITNKSFEYTGNANLTTLTATVTGLDASNVQAVFVRMFNATQGTRMDPVDLEFIEGTGWVGTPSFTMPGTYVLNSLWVDGVEYALPETITVTVDGLNIKLISFCPSGDNLALTADNYTTRPISVSIDADANSQPSNLSVRFESEDGKFVSSNLSYDSTNNIWSGTVKFASSGNYTLTYLVMDGAYVDVTEYNKTFSAYLGLRTNVYMSSEVGLNFPYSGEEVKIRVLAQILTDTDSELKNLDNVKLYYAKRGESVLEKGVNTGLEWNGSYYEGYLRVKDVGVYNFNQLWVGSNVITVANTAPTISVYSLDPPQYVNGYLSYNNNSYTTGIVVANDSNTISYVAVMDNVSGAEKVEAVFTDPSGKTNVVVVSSQFVENSDGSTSVYFTIPNTSNKDYKSGKWVVTSLRAYGVYDEDGNFYGTSDDPDFVPYAEFYPLAPNYEFSIVDNVSVSIDSDNYVTIGSADSAAEFMSEQTVTQRIPVTITTGGVDLSDYDLEIKSAAITFTHKSGTNSKYGGYTYSVTTGYETRGAYPLSMDADGNWYLPANVASVILAGEYTYTVDVVVDLEDDDDDGTNNFADVTFEDRTDGGIVLTVWSEKPTVKISSVSANPTTARYYTSATPGDTEYASMITGNYNNKITDYSAVVYMYFAAKSNYDAEAVEIKYPTVNLSLSGVPSTHSGVTFVVPNGTNSSYSNTFTFAAGGTTASGSIGAGTNGTYDYGYYVSGYGIDTYPVLYPAEDQTVSQITVTYGGIDYNVNLKQSVMINNPVCPPFVTYTDISSIDSTYTGSTPSKVYSTDGETITITLPIIASWSYEKTDNVNGAFTEQSRTENVYYGYVRSGNFWNYQYTPYYETTVVSQATSTSSTYTVTKEITGWKIGNTTFKPGDTVTVTGNQTVVAVITETRGAVTTTATTATKTVKTYTAGTTTSSNPGGTRYTSAPTNSETITYS